MAATMSDGYRNGVANAGGALITHIGLVDDDGDELVGGDPAYARQPVTWTVAPASGVGVIRPDDDLVFDIPASTTVAGWRGFNALVAGDNLGGADLANEVYGAQGTYTLLAASTGIKHLNA